MTTDAQPPACDSLRQPHARTPAQLYPTGWFCLIHSPNARAGRPEPPPGPGWPAGSYLHQLENTEPPVEQEQS